MIYMNDFVNTSNYGKASYPAWLIEERYEQCDNFSRDFKVILLTPLFHLSRLFWKH